ncbi:MAG: Calx-beta domain-containing protein, partial [Gemmataceae bacterium]
MSRSHRRTLSAELLEARVTPATLTTFLTRGHTDLNMVYTPAGTPEWNYQAVDEDAGSAYNGDEALIYIGKPALSTRPSGSTFDFIGVPAGGSFYRLPSTEDTNLPYLGAAGEGITSGALDRYNPSTESRGRAAGLGRWGKASLVGVAHTTPSGTVGTGTFSVWQSGDTTPTVFMSSFNDGQSNPDANGLDSTDGISADDAFWVLTAGHTHYNWGFSAAGRYEVQFKLSGYADDGNTTALGNAVQSPTFKFVFSVGNVGTVSVDPATVQVNEDAGTATVTLVRRDGSDGQITIDYAATEGTAKAGEDFTSTSGTVTFADGQKTQTITIPITNDTTEESDESFTVSLSTAGPMTIADYRSQVESLPIVGTAKTATITIRANDASGPNTAPTVTAPSQATLVEDSKGTFKIIIGDAQTAADALVVQATAADGSLFDSTSIRILGTG